MTSVIDCFHDEILHVFCDGFDEFLISNHIKMSELDSNEARWLTVTSDELIQNISFFELIKLNQLLRREKHAQRLKKGFAALIRISDTGEITHITPLAPINIVDFLDSNHEAENLIDFSNLFDTWVTKIQFDKFKQVILKYWTDYFSITNFELTLSYSPKKNEIKFVVSSYLRNPSNIRKYFKRVKSLFPKKFKLNIDKDKKKQQIVFFVTTSDEVYTLY